MVLHLHLDYSYPDWPDKQHSESPLTYGRGRALNLNPYTLEVLRRERDSLERSMDNNAFVWNDPLYTRLPWVDYDKCMAEARSALAEINAEIARWILLPLQKFFIVDHHLDT